MKKKQTVAGLPEVFGNRVSKRRKQLRWSQQQLSERIGVDAETISRFERGVNLPSLLTLEKLAIALSCEISDLLVKQSSHEMTEVEIFTSWIANVAPKDRAFIMTMVKQCCDHFLNSKQSDQLFKPDR